MVIRFFKKSFFPQLVALLLLTVAWWLPETFLLPNAFTFPSGIPWLSFSADILLFLATALVVNNISAGHHLSGRNSYLTAFFFVLTGSASGMAANLTLFLAATLFFALFYQKIYHIQNSPDVILTAFDAGLFLGLSGLFYPPAMLLVLFAWFALVVYQTDQWRAYITLVVGVVLPWFFAFSGFFIYGKPSLLQPWFLKFFHFRQLTNPFTSGTETALFILNAGVTLIAVLWLMNRLQGFKINLRRHILVSLWGLFFTALVLFVFETPRQTIIILTVPASVVLGTFFSQIKKLRWAERFVLLWILFVFINRYLPLFYAS